MYCPYVNRSHDDSEVVRQEGGLWARNLLSAMWLRAIGWLLPYLGGFSQKPHSCFFTMSFLFLSRKGYVSYFFSLDTQYPLPPLFSDCSYNSGCFPLVYSLCFYCPQNSSRASKGFLCFFHLLRMQWKAYFIQVDPTLYLEKKTIPSEIVWPNRTKKSKILDNKGNTCSL